MKHPFRMASIVGTPKVNWLGKRKIFWSASALLIVIGIVSLSSQRKDVLGIEFSSGTQAVFTFNSGAMIPDVNGEDVLPQRQKVEAMLKNAAFRLAEDIGSAPNSEPQPQSAGMPSQAENTANASKSETLKKLAETMKVETLLDPNSASEYMEKFDADADKQISLTEWTQGDGAGAFFAAMDADKNGSLTKEELAESLPEQSYQVSTTVSDADLLIKVVESAFGASLDVRARVEYDLFQDGYLQGLNTNIKGDDKGVTYISSDLAEGAAPEMRSRLIDFVGGAMFVVENVSPSLTEDDLAGRIQTMRLQSDFSDYQFNSTAVVGLRADPTGKGFTTLAVLVTNPNADYVGKPEEWKTFSEGELSLLDSSLKREESLESVSKFDPSVAGRASTLAVIAFILSWMAIVAYLWLRFGSVRWGLAAVVCLIHDTFIAIGMVAFAAFISDSALGRLLLIQPFKIDMAVVAAFLTIIGYSVNDTIVVFDRIRENRGKLAGLDAKIINCSINQTLSRTLLTTTTTLLAVVIMYIWGGMGIHPFTYTLLVGIIVGTYSSIAVASPLLLGVKKALVKKVVGESPKTAK